jgi:hypothetical protein
MPMQMVESNEFIRSFVACIPVALRGAEQGGMK